jgi:hypothetical protein
MKKFIAVFMGSATGDAMKKWMELSEDARKKREADGMAAWKNWAETHSKSILEIGGPLGKTKKIDASGVSDIKNLLTGYSIIEAESHEAAAKMFLKHPHFTLFPGDSIEVMECLAIPK